MMDFPIWWILFGVIFAILRAITDSISDRPVKFIMPVEMAGRSVLALWGGWLMVCLVAFTLQMAPIDSETPLGAWADPDAGSFLGLAPEQQWLGFLQSRSQGALARANFSGHVHPDDVERNCEAFDPFSEFPFRYHDRRAKYAAADSMRVAQ
jgi:flagellar biosynthesis protein FliQ